MAEKFKIKVSDIIPYPKDLDNKMLEQIKRLGELKDAYMSAGDNIHTLEEIKREIVGILAYLSTLYGKIKRFKGSNHTFMEEERKVLKARVIKKLVDGGMSFTTADKLCYDDDEYKDYSATMGRMKEIFTGYEAVVDIYQYVLQSVIQSISVLSKEKSNYNNVS